MYLVVANLYLYLFVVNLYHRGRQCVFPTKMLCGVDIRVANSRLGHRKTSPSDSNIEAFRGRGKNKSSIPRDFEDEEASNLLMRFEVIPQLSLEFRG